MKTRLPEKEYLKAMQDNELRQEEEPLMFSLVIKLIKFAFFVGIVKLICEI